MKRNLRIRLGLLIVAVVAMIVGCGGGSGGSGGGVGNSSTGQVNTKAAIILPKGFSLPASALHVTTLLGKAPVSAAGSFTAQSTGTGPLMVGALNSAGKLIMLGFVEPGVSGGINEISSQQTSVALLYIAIGGFTTDAQQYAKLLSLINASPATAQLASVLSARLVINPTAITDGDAQITNALQIARQSILPADTTITAAGTSATTALARTIKSAPATTSSTITVSRGAASRATGSSALQNLVLVTPNPSDQQSGIQIEQDPNGPGIFIVNNFRRHCQAYIYKTGDVDANGNTIAADPPQEFGEPIDVPATQRLSGVIGSVLDIAEGKVFWSPIQVGPYTLPLDTNMKKTIYTVVVVGPSFSTNVTGILTDPRFTAEEPIWQNEITALSYETFIGDLLVPTLLAVVVPQATTSDVLGDNRLIQFNQDAVNIITQDAPQLWKDMQELTEPGSNKPATCAAMLKDFVTALAGIPEFRSELLNRLFELPSLSNYLNKEIEDGPEIMEAIGKANEFLEALDLAMRAGDDAAILHDFVVSNSAESWEVDIVQPNVKLNPSTATVSTVNNIVVLTASIPNVSDLSSFRFVWTTTGTEGQLEKALSSTSLPTGPIPDSSADYVTDLLKLRTGGSDTVTVTVFNADNLSTPIGSATSKITANISITETGVITHDTTDVFSGSPEGNLLTYNDSLVLTVPLIKGASSYHISVALATPYDGGQTNWHLTPITMLFTPPNSLGAPYLSSDPYFMIKGNNLIIMLEGVQIDPKVPEAAEQYIAEEEQYYAGATVSITVEK